MITYSKKGNRHIFGMNTEDLKTFAEIVFLLRNSPPPIGYNRRPLTMKQKEIVEKIFERINFGEDYGIKLNEKNGQ